MEHYDVLIVGSGHGGSQAAISLRQMKFAGTIAMVSAEPWLPYERPPLSKDYLAGQKCFERLLIRPQSFWENREVKLHLRRTIVSVNRALREVQLDDGTHMRFTNLIWACGGRPRRLACTGFDQPDVFHTKQMRC